MVLRFLPALLLLAALTLAGAILPGLTPPPPAAAHGTNLAVTNVVIQGTPNSGGAYATGETITVRLSFNQCIKSYTSAALTITLDSGSVTASAPGSHTASQNVDFSYVVLAADYDYDGIVVASGALSGNYSVPAVGSCSGSGDHNHTAQAIPDGSNCCETAQAAHKVNWTDYDTDGDRLIEIANVDQLNAIRWDSNGDGVPNVRGIPGVSDVLATFQTSYRTAFPNSDIAGTDAMGCDVGGAAMQCLGYELAADLDFAGTDYVTGAGWEPIPYQHNSSTSYTGQFQGNGYIISNLTINYTGATSFHMGLFSSTTNNISNVGLVDVSLTSATGNTQAGGLVGHAQSGTIAYCYVNGGAITDTTGDSNMWFGGLAGVSSGATIIGSYSTASVTSKTTGGSVYTHAGGLVGYMYANSSILASYAYGNVTGGNLVDNETTSGGLIGRAIGGVINATYSTGTVTTAGSAHRGGYLGRAESSPAFSNNYWDTDTSQLSASNGVGVGTVASGITGQTTSALKMPTGYNGIYANWNLDLDNADGDNSHATGQDNPWDFVDAENYPVLRFEYGSDAAANERETRARNFQIPTDYDGDGDGLIDVSTVDQLNAIRWDLNGDGTAAGAGSSGYRRGFPRRRPRHGLPRHRLHRLRTHRRPGLRRHRLCHQRLDAHRRLGHQPHLHRRLQRARPYHQQPDHHHRGCGADRAVRRDSERHH